jgi:hypothetical protein
MLGILKFHRKSLIVHQILLIIHQILAIAVYNPALLLLLTHGVIPLNLCRKQPWD